MVLITKEVHIDIRALILYFVLWQVQINQKNINTRMWANAQRDGHPAEYRWRQLVNAAKFG